MKKFSSILLPALIFGFQSVAVWAMNSPATVLNNTEQEVDIYWNATGCAAEGLRVCKKVTLGPGESNIYQYDAITSGYDVDVYVGIPSLLDVQYGEYIHDIFHHNRIIPLSEVQGFNPDELEQEYLHSSDYGKVKARACVGDPKAGATHEISQLLSTVSIEVEDSGQSNADGKAIYQVKRPVKVRFLTEPKCALY